MAAALCSSHFSTGLEEIIISTDRIETGSKQRKKRSKKARARRKILITGSVAIAFMLVLLAVLLMLPDAAVIGQMEVAEDNSAYHLTQAVSQPKIPRGVSIEGISVGKMTEEKAIAQLQKRISHKIETQPMQIRYGDAVLDLEPQDTEVRWDIETAVKTAMRGQNQKVPLTIAVNEETVLAKLRGFFGQFGGIYSPSGCYLEGEMPDVETGEGICQMLVLTKGTSGLVIDLQDVLDRIMEGYRADHFMVEVAQTDEYREAKELDLNVVYSRVSIDPINPDIERSTLEIIPGKNGYGFDIQEAESILKMAGPGDSIRIPMRYLAPEMTEEDAWFQDVLGYCKTEHTDSANRNENLRLACSMLNGKILQPGEELSYNQTLGKRTREAGYKPAPAYSGTELVDEIGGGICQVSSTLYLSSLFAELTIVERRNHGFPANYIPLGLDATVNWGTTDLKIRNDYDLPVKILAEVDDMYVRVRIMGIEQRDYYVKMEYRVDDHPAYAAAYRCRYDRATDEQISRTLNHTSTYLDEVWCWPGFAENAVDDPV